jgi:glycosyltransferase involved in cell wall biosynthesis
MKVLITGENASELQGGEAVHPLDTFQWFRRAGVDCQLLVHERSRSELYDLIDSSEHHRLHFVPDTTLQARAFSYAEHMPQRLRPFLIEPVSHMITSLNLRTEALKLVVKLDIDVVFQPTPLAPLWPSCLYDLGAPMVFGPLNGGISYHPNCFRKEHPFLITCERVLRWLARQLNRLIPGKKKARLLLIGNERTRAFLPASVAEVRYLPDNTVELALWEPVDQSHHFSEGPVRIAYFGRLVDWKCPDIFLSACAAAAERADIEIDIVGGGPELPQVKAFAEALGIAHLCRFHGWVERKACPKLLAESHVLVTPTLREAGGCVVLEAMALGIPVIATDWLGPADYLDPSCGILIPPGPKERFRSDFAEAIVQLANAPELRAQMGLNGRRKVENHFGRQAKFRELEGILREVARN